jgi:predicted Zn-dependent protease
LLAQAQLEQSQGSLDNAIEKYRRIRERNPGNLPVGMLLATLLHQKGDMKQAKAIYEDILERRPDSAVAVNNLAYYYAEYEPTKDNLAKAAGMIEPLLEKHKDISTLVDTAAWIYFRQGKLTQARDLLLGLGERTRETPVIAFHLGMIYKALGETENAKQYLRLSLKQKDAFEGRGAAERALLELEPKG